MVLALIVRGIVNVWVVSWLTLIADRLFLNRYISRTCYGVGVYSHADHCIIKKKREKLNLSKWIFDVIYVVQTTKL